MGADALTIMGFAFSIRIMMPKQTPVMLKASTMKGSAITWAQLNLAASEDLRGLMRRNRYAAELVLALIEHMQPGAAGVVVVSRQTMMEILECSMPTVERALRILISEGWVQRIKIGGAHALAINHRVAWVGPRGEISRAVFGATVIASRSEQDALSLAPPPIRPIPVMRRGEVPLMDGPGQEPPSQPELVGVDPMVAYQAELEARGQLRLNVDPDTGEVLS